MTPLLVFQQVEQHGDLMAEGAMNHQTVAILNPNTVLHFLSIVVPEVSLQETVPEELTSFAAKLSEAALAEVGLQEVAAFELVATVL